MKYSLCSISFRHELVSFHDLVRFAREQEFAGIELWGIHARAVLRRCEHEVPSLLDRMEADGVRISMISDYIDLYSEDDQVALKRGRELFALAKTFRTRKVRIFAGNRPSAMADSETWTQCIIRLRELARMASEHDSYLVIETHPDTLADTLSSTLRLLRETNHAHLRVNLDFLHAWEWGSDPIDAYRELKSWTVNYHLKNISGRNRLDVFAPNNVYSPSGDRIGLTALSDGVVDYSAIIEQLVRDDSPYTASIEWFGEQPFRYLESELAWLKKQESLRDVSINS
ncbi:sugar phosphate isomerase/epimerase family protein [Cohnella mopanensis]|uniref:sugar phosphate isomerase/epimerase family protein n=1 Tax=Cohnella mopanensis TaxID=2911966 RepID=UPI001EF8D873|nr:sugar phosphate isomerase/epimerase [Cohnella mopanensis]